MTHPRTSRSAALTAIAASTLLVVAVTPASAQNRDRDRGERDAPRGVAPPQSPPQSQGQPPAQPSAPPAYRAPPAAPARVQGQFRGQYQGQYQGPPSGQARFQGSGTVQAPNPGPPQPLGRPTPPSYTAVPGNPAFAARPDSRRGEDAGRGPDRDGGRWQNSGRDPGREPGRDGGRNGGRDGARDGWREPGRDGGRDWGRDQGRPSDRDGRWGRDPRWDRGAGERHDWRYRGEVHPGFRLSPYRYPNGWGYRSWRVGERLPFLFLTSYYFLDAYAYDLPPAPYGYRWVRYGTDALLVNVYTGEVEDVVYGIFYW